MPRPLAGLLLASLLIHGVLRADEASLSTTAQANTGVSLTTSVTPVSANGLSLDVALQEAFSRSPQLAGLRAASDEQDWSRQLALAGALPRIDLQGSQIFDARYSYLGVRFGGAAVSFPSAFPDSSLEASVRWTVFDGLSTWRQRDAANENSAASALDLRRAEDMLKARVRVAYYEALAASELADVADRNVETLEAHLKVAQDGLASGVGVRLDVLRIESQLEEARADALAAGNRRSTARRALAAAMGQNDDLRPVVGELPVPDPAALAALPRRDPATRPDLQAVQHRVQALEAARQATTASWMPSLSLFASGDLYHETSRFDDTVLDSDGYQNAYSWGARLDWNLLDGGASLSKRHMAEDRLTQARERSRELALTVPNEVENLRDAFDNGTRLYEARRRGVEKAEENDRLSRLGLSTGTRTHNEVLDAELDLFRARASLVRAQADAAEALALLEAAQGGNR